MVPVHQGVYKCLRRYKHGSNFIQCKTRCVNHETRHEHSSPGAIRRPGFQKETLIQYWKLLFLSSTFLDVQSIRLGTFGETEIKREWSLSTTTYLTNISWASILCQAPTRILWNYRWLSMLFIFKKHQAFFSWINGYLYACAKLDLDLGSGQKTVKGRTTPRQQAELTSALLNRIENVVRIQMLF